MTIEQLKRFCEATPFQAFVMHLADGREVSVPHREFIMPSPAGRTVAVYQADGTLNVIDLLLVTDIEMRPTGNGSRKRRRR